MQAQDILLGTLHYYWCNADNNNITTKCSPFLIFRLILLIIKANIIGAHLLSQQAFDHYLSFCFLCLPLSFSLSISLAQSITSNARVFGCKQLWWIDYNWPRKSIESTFWNWSWVRSKNIKPIFECAIEFMGKSLWNDFHLYSECVMIK